MILDTEIQGVPCRVRVTHYRPARPGRTWGPPEGCCPDEPAEVEFDVLDLNGRPDPLLESQMDDADARAIEQEIIEAKKAEAAEAAAELAFAEWGAYA